jgi:hypothetical protein
MFRPIYAITLGLAATLAASGATAGPVSLMFRAEGERQASLIFGEDRAAPDALVIETHRVGNPGARLRIWIDSSPTALVEMILGPEQCSFGDDGASCRIEIAGGSTSYNRFVDSFKRGLEVHVEIRNANVMEMTDDISLVGFTAAYDG